MTNFFINSSMTSLVNYGPFQEVSQNVWQSSRKQTLQLPTLWMFQRFYVGPFCEVVYCHHQDYLLAHLLVRGVIRKGPIKSIPHFSNVLNGGIGCKGTSTTYLFANAEHTSCPTIFHCILENCWSMIPTSQDLCSNPFNKMTFTNAFMEFRKNCQNIHIF